MKITTAILCDFAQIREGLLTVASGGITRMWREQMPDTMNVCLALVVQMDSLEAQRPHEVEAVVQGEDGEQVARVLAGFQAEQIQARELGEESQIPMAFDLRKVVLERHGAYSVRVYLDGSNHHTLQFWVKPTTERPRSP